MDDHKKIMAKVRKMLALARVTNAIARMDETGYVAGKAIDVSLRPKGRGLQESIRRIHPD